MTQTEFIKALSNRINLEFDIPFITEEGEQQCIEWTVSKVSTFIPESVRQILIDAADGLDESEIERMKDVLVLTLNNVIDIPWVPESIEGQVIAAVVDALFGFARLGVALA